MRILKPLPASATRLMSFLTLAAWVVTIVVLIEQTYLQPASLNLATDLARYGPTAVWHGVYYRGEKVGFTVSQTTRTDKGFMLEEDARLQMTLFGSASAATIRTRAQVNREFVLQAFDFSLDPGTGATTVAGRVDGAGSGQYRLELAITSAGVTRRETRDLQAPPVMSLNLSRLLASGRLSPGSHHQFTVLDPATLSNTAVMVDVGARAMVRAGDSLLPAFRVDANYRGLRTTSWVTDTGEVVREESPLGLMTVRESPDRAQGLAISARVQADLLKAAAVTPVMRQRIDEGRDVQRLRVRLDGVDLSGFDIDGAGQRVEGNVVELWDRQRVSSPEELSGSLTPFLSPEPLIESDASEIIAEARKAIGDAVDRSVQAERLTRYVNALLDKKPTVSLPSALEVLHTRVGDCNEHTALYVAMARAVGVPARIAVGLVYVHGAFYYHAWPEVFLAAGKTKTSAAETVATGHWMAVDPTLNQFPADSTHLRLLRGGLERQAAILPLIGVLKMTVLDVQLKPESERILVGGPAARTSQSDVALDTDLAVLDAVRAPTTTSRRCWCFGFGGSK